MTQVVVLCGGLATRMRPLSDALPKVLLEVAGRPFLRVLFDRLAACSVDEVVLAVGHLSAAIEAELARAPAPIPTRIVHDGPTPLGTLGALAAMRDALAPVFVVTYGDSYLPPPFDYSALARLLEADAAARGCMAVWHNRDALEPSNCAVARGRVIRYAKGDARRLEGPPLSWIDYGALALRRELLGEVPPGASASLSDLQARLAAAGELAALEVPERFWEIGSPQGLAALAARLADEPRAQVPPAGGQTR